MVALQDMPRFVCNAWQAVRGALKKFSHTSNLNKICFFWHKMIHSRNSGIWCIAKKASLSTNFNASLWFEPSSKVTHKPAEQIEQKVRYLKARYFGPNIKLNSWSHAKVGKTLHFGRKAIWIFHFKWMCGSFLQKNIWNDHHSIAW